MNELYETKISDVRWWVYDILGNIGWIIWFICTGISFKDGVTLFSVFAAVPAVFMLIGIIELVSERITKLDRVLPFKRVLRGFGALTLGGLLGIAAAAAGVFMHIGGISPVMMAGAVLCFVFAGGLFRRYKKQEKDDT
ncbi:MAG: hypothetical protein IKP75_05300 [Oscillospiraceae bacterium]|nr:hypothetical protein [Oscillospiraceae bacterium]